VNPSTVRNQLAFLKRFPTPFPVVFFLSSSEARAQVTKVPVHWQMTLLQGGKDAH